MTTYSTIDDLPAGTPSGTDNLEVSQGGVSRRVTFAQVGAAAGPLPFLPTAGGTLTGTLNGTVANFSGEITAANPALGDNDTTVATTRWVKDQGYAGAAGFLPIGGGTLTGNLNGTTAAFTGNVTFPTQTPGTNNTTGATTAYVTAAVAASPAGSVTTVSVTPANGLAGTVLNPTTAPAITLSTSVTGVLKGNGTAISAAVANSDYLPTTSPTFNGTMTGGAYAGTSATLSAAPAYPNNTTSVATTAFVTAGIAAVSGGGPFLPLTGGTLAGPGTLTGTTATMSGQYTTSYGGPANPAIVFNAAAGNHRYLQWQSGASARWQMGVDNIAEGGSNAGSNLFLNTFTDAGAYLGTPLAINRATNAATFSGAVTAPGIMYLHSEQTLGTAGPQIVVTIPAGAKRVELEYSCSSTGDFTGLIQAMVSGTPNVSNIYSTQYTTAVSTTVGAALSASIGGINLGSAQIFSGRVSLRPNGTTWQGTVEEWAQNNASVRIWLAGACDFSLAGVTGFRFFVNTGTPNLAVGSYLRCYVVY